MGVICENAIDKITYITSIFMVFIWFFKIRNSLTVLYKSMRIEILGSTLAFFMCVNTGLQDITEYIYSEFRRI